MDFQSPAGKLAAEHLDQYRQETPSNSLTHAAWREAFAQISVGSTTGDRPPLVKDGSEWSSLLRSMAPDPGPYFTSEQWAERCRGAPVSATTICYDTLNRLQRDDEVRQQMAAGIGLLNSYTPMRAIPYPAQQATVTGYDAYGKPVAETVTLPMIDWQKLAEMYAAGLKEANSKIRLLEDEVARLTPPAPQPERTTSDVLARCIGLDKPLDAYGR